MKISEERIKELATEYVEREDERFNLSGDEYAAHRVGFIMGLQKAMEIASYGDLASVSSDTHNAMLDARDKVIESLQRRLEKYEGIGC